MNYGQYEGLPAKETAKHVKRKAPKAIIKATC